MDSSTGAHNERTHQGHGTRAFPFRTDCRSSLPAATRAPPKGGNATDRITRERASTLPTGESSSTSWRAVGNNHYDHVGPRELTSSFRRRPRRRRPTPLWGGRESEGGEKVHAERPPSITSKTDDDVRARRESPEGRRRGAEGGMDWMDCCVAVFGALIESDRKLTDLPPANRKSREGRKTLICIII